jgi:hypothetical protein
MFLRTSTLSKTKEKMLMSCLDALKYVVTPRVLHGRGHRGTRGTAGELERLRADAVSGKPPPRPCVDAERSLFGFGN